MVNNLLWAQVGFIKECEGNPGKSGLWTEKDIFQNFATLVLSTQESVGPEFFVGDSPRPKLSEKVYIVGAILYPSTTSRRIFYKKSV